MLIHEHYVLSAEAIDNELIWTNLVLLQQKKTDFIRSVSYLDLEWIIQSILEFFQAQLAFVSRQREWRHKSQRFVYACCKK